MADTRDLKSLAHEACGFDSHLAHHKGSVGKGEVRVDGAPTRVPGAATSRSGDILGRGGWPTRNKRSEWRAPTPTSPTKFLMSGELGVEGSFDL